MATISLVRIDSRLIHGQVIAKWRKQTNATDILVIDDDLAKDPFMKRIYEIAAPPGTRVAIVSSDDSIQLWKKDAFGSGRLIILFRSVASAVQAWQKGFPIERLQVGGIGGGPGRKQVYESIALDHQDSELLSSLIKGGVPVYFQVNPENKPVSYESIKVRF